jgi:hypothetical protein
MFSVGKTNETRWASGLCSRLLATAEIISFMRTDFQEKRLALVVPSAASEGEAVETSGVRHTRAYRASDILSCKSGLCSPLQLHHTRKGVSN